MTYREDFNVPSEILEKISTQGQDIKMAHYFIMENERTVDVAQSPEDVEQRTKIGWRTVMNCPDDSWAAVTEKANHYAREHKKYCLVHEPPSAEEGSKTLDDAYRRILGDEVWSGLARLHQQDSKAAIEIGMRLVGMWAGKNTTDDVTLEEWGKLAVLTPRLPPKPHDERYLAMSNEEARSAVHARWANGELPIADMSEREWSLLQQEWKHQSEETDNLCWNIEYHRLFLNRLNKLEKYLKEEEQKHIQALLVKCKWGENEIAEVKRIIENAEWFNRVNGKAESEQEADR